MIDNIIIGLNDSATTAELKGVFGLPNITHNDDFAQAVAGGIDAWQGKNWDPEVNDPSFDQYCGNITTQRTLLVQSRICSRRVDMHLKSTL
jgi:hypothetical protein